VDVYHLVIAGFLYPRMKSCLVGRRRWRDEEQVTDRPKEHHEKDDNKKITATTQVRFFCRKGGAVQQKKGITRWIVAAQGRADGSSGRHH